MTARHTPGPGATCAAGLGNDNARVAFPPAPGRPAHLALAIRAALKRAARAADYERHRWRAVAGALTARLKAGAPPARDRPRGAGFRAGNR